MRRTIKFVGNEHTNQSSRRGHKPCCIVNHISEGTKESCVDWFTSSGNTVSSAHFLVGKDGSIYQFVPIEKNAWANGLKQYQYQYATASIVEEQGVNPNWYSVSIEHEGVYTETWGKLTKEQLEASVWLHKYIIDYVKEHFGVEIPIDRDHILGHCEIDSIRKPSARVRSFRLIYSLKECKRKWSCRFLISQITGLKTTSSSSMMPVW